MEKETIRAQRTGHLEKVCELHFWGFHPLRASGLICGFWPEGLGDPWWRGSASKDGGPRVTGRPGKGLGRDVLP